MADRYNEEIEKMHEEEKWFLAQHPVCVICQEKIQDGTAFYNRKIGYMQWMYRGRHVGDNKRMNDFVKEYLETQRFEADYECRTAHKAIKRGAVSCSEYEQGYEEELEQ